MNKMYKDLFEIIRIRSNLELIASDFHKKPYGMADFFVRTALNRINLVILDCQNENDGTVYNNPAHDIFKSNFKEIMDELNNAAFQKMTSKDKHKLNVQYRKLEHFMIEHKKTFNKKQARLFDQAKTILHEMLAK